MRALALDLTTGDLAISAGRLQLVNDTDAVRQKLQMRLRLWAGEWFADTSVGIPFASILGQKASQLFAETTLRRAITTCPGVAALESFNFSVVNRHATVTFRVRAVTGETITVTDFRADATDNVTPGGGGS